MRSASRPLRNSVVRVIAAFVPLSGCADEQGLISNPPPYNPPNYPPTCADPQTPGCFPPIDAGRSRDAATQDGTADARDPSCPSEAPADDEPCALPASKLCEYGSCYGQPTEEARCKGGRWELLISSCNPPFVPCPDQEPTPDAGCDQEFGPSSCSYGTCDGGPAATYACEDARWQVARHCPAPCPGEVPAQGLPCSEPGAHCEYGSCFGYPTRLADCVAGSWHVGEVSCNPPPPDPCPSEAPREGAACDHVGTTCAYEQPLAVASADCVNGSWRITTAIKDAGS